MATLKSLVDETTNIKNEIVECRDTLKQILIDKKLEGVANENRLSALIAKINYLGKTFLYKDGDECNALTNGWGEISSKNNGSIIKNSSSVTMKANLNGEDSAYRSIITNAPINLAKFKTLNISIKSLSVTNSAYFIFRISEKKTSAGAYAIATISANENLNEVIKTLDVSNINSDCYIIVGVDTGSVNANKSVTLEFDKIWAES